MATIYVKTKAGRVAYYNGKPIPHDKFMAVQETSTMRRLVDVWEDVEVQSAAPSSASRRPAPSAPNPTTPAPAAAPKKETN